MTAKMVTILHDVTVTVPLWVTRIYLLWGVPRASLEVFQARKGEFMTLFQTLILKIP